MIPFDLALAELKKVNNPEDKIIQSSAYWQPFQLVYVEMVKNGDLIPLSDLEREQKERYWSLVKGLDFKQWKKISIAQALYCYEVIS